MPDDARLVETAALIALLRRGQRPWHHYAELVEARGSASAVLEPADVDGRAVPRLFEDPVAASVDLEAIVTELKGWEREGMSVVSVLDSGYPINLRTIYNRPPLLFIRGALTAADERSVAVIGTRRASEDGLLRARSLAAEFVDAGYTVTSGLAEGIDRAAHVGALERGGRTVAVIGTGLRRAYPAANADLQKRIATEGAVLSQFWPDTPPSKQTFPLRNVVMSGFARATVIVEAPYTSGARMQARLALEHGRPVFLLDSLLEHEWARDFAENPGTYVVAGAGEVVDRVERLTSAEVLRA